MIATSFDNDDGDDMSINSSIDWNEVGDALLHDFDPHFEEDLFGNRIEVSLQGESGFITRCASYNAMGTIATPTTANDILKSYAKSIESAINSHELQTLKDVLESCATPELTCIVHYPKGNPHGYAFRQMSGRCTSIRYLHTQFATVPDSLFLVHDTQILDNESGHKTVKSKFSCNGTRLYTVSAEQQGCRLPDSPALTMLQEQIKSITLRSPKEIEFTSQANGSVTLRNATNISKFDRYKPTKGSTLGVHIEYNGFSESSMQNKKKKFNDYIKEHSSRSDNTNNSNINNNNNDNYNNSNINSSEKNNSSSNSNQRRSLSEDSCRSINSNNSNNSHNSNNNSNNNSNSKNIDNTANSSNNCSNENILAESAESQRIAGIASSLAEKYLESERFYANQDTKFVFSALLAIPVKLDAHGVMKLYVNSDNKITMLEIMLSVKPLYPA